MFPFINKTWNPVKGCLHNCRYCWARSLAEGKLKNSPRYLDGFKPKLIEAELGKRFKKDAFVFVSDMGDLFGEWVPRVWIDKVFEAIRNSPEAKFLLLTKNPHRFLEFREEIPDNCVLGATIESNRDYPQVSGAPGMGNRLDSMIKLSSLKQDRFVSVEPIEEFDLEPFVDKLKQIKPCMVAVGLDNYSNGLVEPRLEKTERLIKELEVEGIQVVRKSIREAVSASF